ncbi:gamma-glutamylcyclotransferase family protein [uncultured Devosia sp.]|uniref:gamma-glutamylcyclotransferase family protein n=1 Tax=uncultured Devosia sp. TaxID=211434 RepID=UPI0035CB3A3F
MTPHPLFVYGTLRDPDLRRALLSRRADGDAITVAQAPGFRAVHMPGRVYPGLVALAGASAPGLLLQGLTAAELDMLDAFEGDEYHRATLVVLTETGETTAMAYLPTMSVSTDATPWTLAHWSLIHKPDVLAGEIATVTTLRARLTAR